MKEMKVEGGCGLWPPMTMARWRQWLMVELKWRLRLGEEEK